MSIKPKTMSAQELHDDLERRERNLWIKGAWEEAELIENSDGRRYRYSQIIAADPHHPDRSIPICDTLNAFYCMCEIDREDLMAFIVTLRNNLPTILVALETQAKEDAARTDAVGGAIHKLAINGRSV